MVVFFACVSVNFVLFLYCRDGIVLFRPLHLRNKFEEDSIVYSGAAATSEIDDFIHKN